MKTGNLKIGISDPKFGVVVGIDVAETLEDVSTLAKGNIPYVVAAFMRGHRINLQESEARSTVADMAKGKLSPQLADPKFVEKVTKAVETVLKTFDPTAEKKRGGRPAGPVEVSLDTTKTYTAAQMQEILAAAGAKVQFVSSK